MGGGLTLLHSGSGLQSGDVDISSAPPLTSGNASGAISISTADSVTGTSGAINVGGGSSAVGTGGGISVVAGDSSNTLGAGGSIVAKAGQGEQFGGSIELTAGTAQSTAGADSNSYGGNVTLQPGVGNTNGAVAIKDSAGDTRLEVTSAGKVAMSSTGSQDVELSSGTISLHKYLEARMRYSSSTTHRACSVNDACAAGPGGFACPHPGCWL